MSSEPWCRCFRVVALVACTLQALGAALWHPAGSPVAAVMGCPGLRVAPRKRSCCRALSRLCSQSPRTVPQQVQLQRGAGRQRQWRRWQPALAGRRARGRAVHPRAEVGAAPKQFVLRAPPDVCVARACSASHLLQSAIQWPAQSAALLAQQGGGMEVLRPTDAAHAC